MSSEAAALLKLIDLALAATTAIEEHNRAVARINERLRRAQNGEPVTWDEVTEKQAELSDLIERGRAKVER